MISPMLHWYHHPWKKRTTSNNFASSHSVHFNYAWTTIPIGSMYGMYANIGGILMVNVSIQYIYTPYMDPMGLFGSCQLAYFYCVPTTPLYVCFSHDAASQTHDRRRQIDGSLSCRIAPFEIAEFGTEWRFHSTPKRWKTDISYGISV